MNRADALAERYATICYGAATIAEPYRKCGNAKAQGHAFCFFCWKKLPMHLQRLLNTNKGYANAIYRSKQHLAQQCATVPDLRD